MTNKPPPQNKVKRLKQVAVSKDKKQNQLKRQVAQRLQVARIFLQRAMLIKKKDLIILAAEMYLDILKFHPKCVDAYVGLAKIEYHFGQIDKCLMLLNQARQINPKNKNLYKLIQKIRHIINKEFQKDSKEQNIQAHPIKSKPSGDPPISTPASSSTTFHPEELTFPTNTLPASEAKKKCPEIDFDNALSFPSQEKSKPQMLKSKKVDPHNQNPDGFSVLNI